MDINNNSYKLTYEESFVALTGSTMLGKKEAYKTDEDVIRLVRLITNSIETSRSYIAARLEYRDKQSPTLQMVDENCKEMSSSFISLPKDETSSRILPLAVETYFWNAHETEGLAKKDRLAVATNMLMQLMISNTEETH